MLGSLNVIVLPDPIQSDAAPAIAPGVWFTVSTWVASNPQPVENLIVAVPAIPATTRPPDDTLATDGLSVDHVPDPASVSAVVPPVHNVCDPEIAPADPLILNVITAAQVPTV